MRMLFAGLAAFWLVSAEAARADDVQVLIAPATRPILLENGQVDGKIEPSGAEPIGDGKLFLVADDKTPGLVLVDAGTGARVGSPLKVPGAPEQPKWEAMARDEAGRYYVSGSHSGATAPIVVDHSYVFRFRLKPGAVPEID